MVSLDATVVVAAFPALRSYFSQASAADLSWTINAYTIVFAALLVPAGRLVDQFGHRRCFLMALAGFTLASAVCAMAPDPVALAAARSFKGASAALLSPASLALILAAFPAEQRPRSAGLWTAAGALGAAMGPAIGSLLITAFSWRTIFFMNVPMGLLVLAWAGSHGKRDPIPGTAFHFDRLGTVLLVAGVACLSGGLAHAGPGVWNSKEVVQPTVWGIALLGIFFFYARGREDAALDLRLFADRNYRWASAATLVLGMAFGLMFLSFYLFFTGVWQFSQTFAGLAAMPGPLLATGSAMFASTRQIAWGQRRLLTIGGVGFAISHLWLALRISPVPDYFGTWLPAQILGGLAIGFMLPSLTGAAVAGLTPRNLGIGVAVNNAIRQLGSSFGVALAIAIAGPTTAGVASFQSVYFCLTAAGLLIAMLAQPLLRQSPVSPHPV
jgi:EmrB/QacA subfamily drug resistance transporter